MTDPPDHFPYRCLPLATANSLGWDILNPVTVVARWNGGPGKADLTVRSASGKGHCACSHFGIGVLTFTMGHLFRTSPGVAMLVLPPVNFRLRGATGLIGYVETDWLPATFTYNYLLDRPGEDVVFEAGMPICRILPYPRGWVTSFDCRLLDVSERPEIEADHRRWERARSDFNRELSVPGSEAASQKWQRDYFLGGGDKGTTGLWPKAAGHETRIRCPPFQDLRRSGRTSLPQERDLRRVNVSQPGMPPVWIWVRRSLGESLFSAKQDGSGSPPGGL
jgi:hypothetical protein